MTSPGDILQLDITGIAHGGVCIARHEGRVVFVSDAIPGERVRARVTDASKKSFLRADTVEVLDASPHRRQHIWRAADLDVDPAQRPGGADFGHIDLGHQRALKQQVLQDSLDRFAGGGIAASEVRALDDTDGTGWRTRMTLHVDTEGRVGPFVERSHRVVQVDELPLARPLLAEAALAVRRAAPGRIDFVEPGDGRTRVIARPEGGGRPDPEVVFETVGDRRFHVDADGFWQVHPRAAATLDRAVRGALADRIDPDATHLDLYGGVGLFAATLADLGARRIVTVESSRRATAHAAANLAAHDVDAVTARVDRYLARMQPAQARAVRGGTVVLDPPRAGAGSAVVEALDALSPAAIVYVACDPVALSRDLGTFGELGWPVASLDAFDLFPHSHHFETIALLTR